VSALRVVDDVAERLLLRAGQLEGQDLAEELADRAAGLAEAVPRRLAQRLPRARQKQLDEKQFLELEPPSGAGQLVVVFGEVDGSQRHAPFHQVVLRGEPVGKEFA